MPIARDEVDRVRRSANLLELVSSELRKVANTHGGEYAGPCPFCGGEDRFHCQPFAERGGRWFCRQCTGEPPRHHWCDAIDFVKRRDHLSFVEAVERLRGQGVSVTPVSMTKRSVPRLACHSPRWQKRAHRWVAQAVQRLHDPQSGADARAYLRSRAIQPATWQAWGLGCGVAWHMQRQQRMAAIFLPWCEGSRVQAVQYRFIDPMLGKKERFGQLPGGERLLFGLPLLTGQARLILVEGELNAVSLWQACREMGWDVLSWGAQANLCYPPATKLAVQIAQRGYQRVVLWADELAMAERGQLALSRSASSLPPISLIASPIGQDANDLLQRDELGEFVQSFL